MCVVPTYRYEASAVALLPVHVYHELRTPYSTSFETRELIPYRPLDHTMPFCSLWNRQVMDSAITLPYCKICTKLSRYLDDIERAYLECLCETIFWLEKERLSIVVWRAREHQGAVYDTYSKVDVTVQRCQWRHAASGEEPSAASEHDSRREALP